MNDHSLLVSIFLIFGGAAAFATIALYTRQSLLVGYILLGVVIGPWGLDWVGAAGVIRQVGEFGIIFLLFLLGLDLQPQNLWHMLRKATLVGLLSSLVFGAIGFVIAWLFSFGLIDSVIIGAAMMFSSTIIGLKLLPTTVLHHQHTGEVMISVLLMQDLIAILVLLVINSVSTSNSTGIEVIKVLIGFPVLIIVAFLAQRFVLVKLVARFDRIKEYIFLLAIGWCLSMAQLAGLFGLSDEIGAFVAGVALAASPISLYIAESLKPLRDFFLVLFFFAVGAGFNTNFLSAVWLPALIIAVVMLVVKPIVFRYLLDKVSENKTVAWEVGTRLGQVSEFSILIGYFAFTGYLITPSSFYLIQATAIISFFASSYLVVLKYPTPLAFRDDLRRD